MPLVDFKLYMIGDRHQCAGRALPEIVQAAAEAGVPAFQFREKDLPLKAQFELASKIRKVTKKFGMKLLINDRIDLCLAIDADGVHLPVSGLPISAARRLLGSDKLIGASCHQYKELKNAEVEGANFAVLGPVYDTPSKRPYGSPLGLSEFKRIRESTGLPLFAIGGIQQHRIKEVFSAGADGIAVISAISFVENVRGQCRLLLQEIKRHTTTPQSMSL